MVYKILEYMLRMYVLYQPSKWEDYIHLVEFAYNYQNSLKTSPFEVLYGRWCKVPLSWGNSEDEMDLGPDMLAQMETMLWQIKHNLKVAQDRQKCYIDSKTTTKENNMGEMYS